MIEAPSREVEIRRVLREVKDLLKAGTLPKKIGILAPNTIAYRKIMRAVSDEYSVPISCDHLLGEEPLILDLINLLQLAPDFTWRSTFLALRSAYIQQNWLTSEQIDQLDQLTRDQPVIEGRDQWLSSLRPIQEAFPDIEDEDQGHPPFISTLSPEDIQGLKEGLGFFFDQLTPDEESNVQSYAWWVQTRLLGIYPDTDNPDEALPITSPSLRIFECCQDSPQADRDLAILELILECLRDLVNSHKRLGKMHVVPWQTFVNELINALQERKFSLNAFRTEVLFAPLAEGRVKTFEHLFILGLSEGEFPFRPDPDVFYAPEEREEFPLQIRRYIPAHDASLFWQVLNNVRSQLTLSRPYIDENGAFWQPSPYWEAAQSCFNDLEVDRIPIAAMIQIKEAASWGELMVALAQGHASVVPEELRATYSYAQSAERIHAQRNSYYPPGIFEGVFQSEDLIKDVEELYSPETVWSASKLNMYGNCPFKFFAQNLLKIDARQEPEDGLDAMQRGLILHAILEKTLGILQKKSLLLDVEYRDEVLEALDESCQRIFPSAHMRYGFQPTPLWEFEKRELRRILRVYLTWECTENKKRFQPYLQEAKFGIKGSEKRAYRVEMNDQNFLLRGVIDRIDRDNAGNLQVIDYKSGSTSFTKENITKAIALQTVLYALVAEYFWTHDDERIVKSEYRHLPTRKSSGSLSFSDRVINDEVVRQAIFQVVEHIQRIRKGIFPSATEKSIRGKYACTTYCDYAPLCRVSRQSINKARKAGLK